MSYGALSHIGISAQQSYGTATASWDYLPIISESLVTEIEQLEEEGMRARFESGAVHEGLITVAGDIVFEPHPILMGHFLRGVTGQASGTLTNSVYIWEFIPRQADFSTNCAVPPFALQVYRDNGSAWQFTDSLVNQLSIDISGGTITKATASLLCRVSSLMTKTSPSFPSGNPWNWSQASLSLAGTANGDIESLSFVINNNIEGLAMLDNTRVHGKHLRTGYRESNFSGNMDFASQTEYNKFRMGSEQAIKITITGDTTATSYNNQLVIDIPQAKYSSFPVNISGAGRISVGFDGAAKYNTTSAYAVRFSLTNTRATYAN